MRDRIHQSSIYTNSSTQSSLTKTYGEDQFNNQYLHRSKTDIDPFLGVPTYSEKYEAKARTIPQITGSFSKLLKLYLVYAHKLILLVKDKELFPKELWPTLEGKDGEAVRAGVNRAIKKKAALLADPDFPTRLTGKDRTQSVLDKLDKLKDLGDDADADSEMGDEDKPPEEEHDYDYEEDEDEMGGDYNAEIYFDGGEEEDDDGGDGGDGEY